jgi:hypothetical protein
MAAALKQGPENDAERFGLVLWEAALTGRSLSGLHYNDIIDMPLPEMERRIRNLYLAPPQKLRAALEEAYRRESQIPPPNRRVDIRTILPNDVLAELRKEANSKPVYIEWENQVPAQWRTKLTDFFAKSKLGHWFKVNVGQAAMVFIAQNFLHIIVDPQGNGGFATPDDRKMETLLFSALWDGFNHWRNSGGTDSSAFDVLKRRVREEAISGKTAEDWARVDEIIAGTDEDEALYRINQHLFVPNNLVTGRAQTTSASQISGQMWMDHITSRHTVKTESRVMPIYFVDQSGRTPLAESIYTVPGKFAVVSPPVVEHLSELAHQAALQSPDPASQGLVAAGVPETESDLRPLDPSLLGLSAVSSQDTTATAGVHPLWAWALVLAACCFAGELLLAGRIRR